MYLCGDQEFDPSAAFDALALVYPADTTSLRHLRVYSMQLTWHLAPTESCTLRMVM